MPFRSADPVNPSRIFFSTLRVPDGEISSIPNSPAEGWVALTLICTASMECTGLPVGTFRMLLAPVRLLSGIAIFNGPLEMAAGTWSGGSRTAVLAMVTAAEASTGPKPYQLWNLKFAALVVHGGSAT